MSFRTVGEKEGDLPTSATSNSERGQINNRAVVVASKNYLSKKWFLIAVIIGSVVAIGISSWSALGLLQSHGLITFPTSFKWVASAIGTIGHIPTWSQWAIALGGLGLVGGGITAVGAYKIYKRKMENQQLDQRGTSPEETPFLSTDHLFEPSKNPGSPPLNNPVQSVSPPTTTDEGEGEEGEPSDTRPYLGREIPVNQLTAQEETFDLKKLYETQELKHLKEAKIGDYSFVPISKQKGLKFLLIKDSKKIIQVLIRESSIDSKLFRIVQTDQKKRILSSLYYSAPQISAMYRHAANPQGGIRVSGLTEAIRPSLGLIVFTSDSIDKKTYYIVNRLGALEETSLEALFKLVPSTH